MGNSLGGKKSVKVMKINGETIKLKSPIYAGEVVKDHPGHVLLESEAVKHYGVRAKPLELQQEMKSKRLYFLVELPKFPEEKVPRRVRSDIQMSAKDRLESLMLARRSSSDLTSMKSYHSSIVHDDEDDKENIAGGRNISSSSSSRITMRLPRSQVEKMMMESKDGADAASKIVNFYMTGHYTGIGAAVDGGSDGKGYNNLKGGDILDNRGIKPREKRVGFLPFTEGEIQLVVS